MTNWATGTGAILAMQKAQEQVASPPPIAISRIADIRARLDAGTMDDPRVNALGEYLRTLRGRGFHCTDFDTLCACMGALDRDTFLGARDHAWAVGAPAPAATPEDEAAGRAPDDPRVAPLRPRIDLEDLFADCPAAARVCECTAVITSCSTDLPALGVLAVLSAAVGRKAVGLAPEAGRPGWRLPPALFLVADVASGEGKSLIREHLGGAALEKRTRAILDWHRTLAGADGAHRVDIEDELLRAKAEHAKTGRIEKDKRDPETEQRRTDLGAEIAKWRAELARPQVREPGWLQWGTITAAQLQMDAGRGGFVALFPPEGKDWLQRFIAGGRPGEDALGPLLSMFTGEASGNATRTGEKDGDAIRYSKAYATVFLPIQPTVFSPVTQADGQMLSGLVSRGFFARFLVSRPHRYSKRERIAARPAARALKADGAAIKAASDEWHALVARIMHAEGQDATGGDGGSPERIREEDAVGRPHPLTPVNPWVFTYTPEAATMLLEYQERTGDEAAPGGDFDRHGMAEFVRRLADHAHRIATLLAIARTGRITGGGSVTAADVGRAIRILDGYFVPQAEGVYRRAIYDPLADDADLVLAELRKVGSVMLSALQDRLGGKGGRGWGKAKASDKVTRLRGALEVLESRGLAVLQVLTKDTLVRLVGD